MKAVDRAGYKKPSPIQMAAIPLGLQFRDVIGIAEAAQMLGNPEIEAEGPYSVVLAPTRELAQQIEEETRNLAHYTDFRVVSVWGGQSIEDQGFLLRELKGCEIVVATPGRLVDCIERSYAVLNQCNYVSWGVLDAMPSTNLKPENEDEPLETNRVYRTTYMFSATMPPAVERLARRAGKYLRRPVVVTIGTAGKATDNVTQRVIVKENEKPRALEQELAQMGDDQRIIVFANTKRQCDLVARQLENMDYRVTMLHGGKTRTSARSRSRASARMCSTCWWPPTWRDVVSTWPTWLWSTITTWPIPSSSTPTGKGDDWSYRAVPVARLAQHEAAKQKPGAIGGGRPSIQFAKK
ncbi:hypothetical protein ABPG77_005507 [Micractinium sp. CCAP 211/92]